MLRLLLNQRCTRSAAWTRIFVRASWMVLAASIALVSIAALRSGNIRTRVSAASLLLATPPFSPRAPAQSSAIAIVHNGQFVVNVNPDSNTITVINPTPHQLHKIAEIDVGREPTSIAAHTDNNRVYVANAADGTVMEVNVPGRHV